MTEDTECLEAIYEGKLWNASVLKMRDDSYDEELRLFMRKESQAKKFYCPECSENLILNAGNIRQPYFRHYDGSECVMANADNYSRSFHTRQMLFSLAKRSFPNSEIVCYEGIKNTKYRSQILIHDRHCTMALNYVPDDSKLRRVELMNEALTELGIISVWFCEYSARNFDKMTTMQYQIQKTQPILKFIDVRQGRLYLKKFEYDRGREQLKYQEYLLAGQLLGISGEFMNDFEAPKQSPIEKMIPDTQINRSRDIGFGEKIYSFLEEQGSIEEAPVDFSISDVVKRMPHDAKNEVLKAVFMKEHDEDWLLRKITGTRQEREDAMRIRRALLFYADTCFFQEQQKMKDLIYLIGEQTEAAWWNMLGDYAS